MNVNLSPIITRSTNDLMIPITAMAEHQVDRPIPITVGEYNAIAHLTYISALTDLIEPYLAHAVSMEDEPPSLLQRMASATPSPSHISISSDEDDTDHPGDEWMLYDGNNPKHYALIFINEKNEEEVAKYIRYVSVGDDMHLQGRRSKNTPLYAVPLHARAFSIANFWQSGLRDTDLAIFDPSSDDRLVVDNALFNLGDAGVIADVHTLRAQYTRLANVKRQRVELDNIKRKAEKKKNIMERYLAHAAVRTRLHPHLLKERPASPPSRIVPCIHAAQGPADTHPKECEGEDSLERRRVRKPRTPPGSVLGKRKLPPFPYCLSCHSEDPGHDSGECPYNRTCRFCWSAYHFHNECPSPHLACSTSECVVPLTHKNIGSICSTSLVESGESYEMRLAAGDYDGDLEGHQLD
jgi:hypothetical protein